MSTATSAAQTRRILELLAHADPRWWEIIEPHLPLFDGRLGARSADGDEARLNPQPLPPREAVWRAIRDTAVSVAEATIAASLAGRNPVEVLAEVGDDYCPTPPKFPWPKKWPVPVQVQQQFLADGAHLGPAVQATAGLVFQTYADRTTDEALSSAFSGLAQRLVDTALRSNTP
ncbi:hypothetical protein [Streptomyces griseus]|uniref:hypothetical protein n=1 Tax=Streptomyces griseus TaxID=1911 RepID=UPI00055C07CF|nr:hypothetical protein [Streptomyces griseus]